MAERMTPERRAEIEEIIAVRDGPPSGYQTVVWKAARDLRNELDAVTREREAGSTRVCDQPGCTACVIRRDDGSRVCARGHASRFVERADLDAMTRERDDWKEKANQAADNFDALTRTLGDVERERNAAVKALAEWECRERRHSDPSDPVGPRSNSAGA
jgi:hypothetical protein